MSSSTTAVANQIGRTHADRLVQLQKLVGALVGQFEFPPELKPEQTLVEAARPLAICDAQPDMVENRSLACSLQPSVARECRWAAAVDAYRGALQASSDAFLGDPGLHAQHHSLVDCGVASRGPGRSAAVRRPTRDRAPAGPRESGLPAFSHARYRSAPVLPGRQAAISASMPRAHLDARSPALAAPHYRPPGCGPGRPRIRRTARRARAPPIRRLRWAGRMPDAET